MYFDSICIYISAYNIMAFLLDMYYRGRAEAI